MTPGNIYQRKRKREQGHAAVCYSSCRQQAQSAQSEQQQQVVACGVLG